MRKQLSFSNQVVQNNPVKIEVSGIIDQNKRYVMDVRIESITNENNGKPLDLKTIPIDLLSRFMELGEKMLEEINFANEN